MEQLPQLPSRDAVDEIGDVVSEKGEKKVFDFLDKYKQKNPIVTGKQIGRAHV